MSRHLVTGGAGFVGSALAHRLVREGHEVTVLDRFSRGKRTGSRPRRGSSSGDIRDPQSSCAPSRVPTTIWHLAYVQGTQTFYADPKDVIDVALTGIMNVLGPASCKAQPAGPVPRVLERGVPEPAGRDVPDGRDGPVVGA